MRSASLAAASPNAGDTAWVLLCAALVLLMTPGLALFYGGMVRSKSVLNMMMMSFIGMGTVSVSWILWGYSETFGPDLGDGLLGDPFTHFGLHGVMRAVYGPVGKGIPAPAFVAFQVVFAIIAVALVSGAIADRAKFATWTGFTVLWATLVYFPAAHWVFALSGYAARAGGWIVNDLHVVDFAGGTVIEINAGAAGLALALVLGKRVGFGKEPMRPHNLTLVMIGAGLLWFGWFGFNAGSALSAGTLAAGVWINTLAAGAAGMLGWLAVERTRDGRLTSLGAVSGLVAGLVAITPSCSVLSPVGSVLLAAVAGAVCAWAVGLKHRFGFDDSLDVVGVHLVGGLIGTLGIGLLATPGGPAGATGPTGLFYGGGLDQLGRQALGAGAVLIFSFVMTYAIGLALQKTVGFRVTEDDERAGIDQIEHAETGYDLGHLFSSGRTNPTHHGRLTDREGAGL
ncbi:ammonium transporter [Leekyejoonella antrihumi]|uniref:Ammonium transporter n=1 Tax=Leekyejoonella antrihumi TaxID=1660198 RepID=A0A563DZP0_9MICO|nr:ammonium transporter [Leekyejoonella antrihumi]TWP35589.1 ammonium transporter [Leekyejoonella antrihumi]